MLEPNYIKIIESELSLKVWQIETVLSLTEEGATVPFIARYRKERTGELDENQIRDIIDLRKKEETLYKAKVTALTGIEEQGSLTPELARNIELAKTLKEVEDIYAPYRLKKKTKAMLAIEKWFQVVADLIKKNREYTIPENLLTEYPREEIIEWAIEIIAAEITAHAILRDGQRAYYFGSGQMVSKLKSEKMLEKLNEKVRGEVKKFDIYADFSIAIARIKPYQTLALNRGENLGILAVKIDKDDIAYDILKNTFLELSWSARSTLIPELEEAIDKGYTALFKSVETEIRGILTEKGEDESIRTFQANLWNLLMTKPEYGMKVLWIDPGYRTGCKIVVLDEFGNPLEFNKIYLHELEAAKKIIAELAEKHKIWVVVIGNGTASSETVELVTSVLSTKIYIVNESGASVYSASKVAQEEFPDLDVTDRGTISIARRYIDPLSELVKIPVGSIGVGMYQHDIAESKLEEKLGFTIEDVVNTVGVNVNIASIHVLGHISGFDKRTAKKVYNNRPYKSRKQLEKVLSAKAYEQAAGFLRIPESKESLDNTNIHPEQYELAKYIIENKIVSRDFSRYESELKKYYPEVKISTLEFISESYNAIGADPRTASSHMEVGKKLTLDDVKEWDILNWVVRNVVAFWAFVDVGLKNDWLVHVSQIADTYVADPMDFVKIWEKVKVKVTGIDREKGKLQLSMRGI